MQYILIAIVLMVLCVFGLSCKKSTPPAPSGVSTTDLPTVSSGQYLSRQDIQKQLAVIANKPPPKILAMGAMCYKIAGPPTRFDYVCPACGEKTLYVMDTADEEARRQFQNVAWKFRDMETLRRLTQQIDKLDVRLDELEFCTHCSSKTESPKVALVIQYPDQPKPIWVWDVTPNDLLMLKAFADGQLKYKNQQDFEAALKKNLPRLEELLGVKTEYMSLEDIQKQLAVIAKAPPPKELALGAMCYMIAGLPERIDYVCPTCGEKTLYAGEVSDEAKMRPFKGESYRHLQSLEDARRLVRSIDKLDIQLDESRFCHKCSPDAQEPELAIIIRYPGSSVSHHVNLGLIEWDLEILKSFNDGELKFKLSNDGEVALQKHMGRLEELLGVDIDDTEE